MNHSSVRNHIKFKLSTLNIREGQHDRYTIKIDDHTKFERLPISFLKTIYQSYDTKIQSTIDARNVTTKLLPLPDDFILRHVEMIDAKLYRHPGCNKTTFVFSDRSYQLLFAMMNHFESFTMDPCPPKSRLATILLLCLFFSTNIRKLFILDQRIPDVNSVDSHVPTLYMLTNKFKSKLFNRLNKFSVRFHCAMRNWTRNVQQLSRYEITELIELNAYRLKSISLGSMEGLKFNKQLQLPNLRSLEVTFYARNCFKTIDCLLSILKDNDGMIHLEAFAMVGMVDAGSFDVIKMLEWISKMPHLKKLSLIGFYQGKFHPSPTVEHYNKMEKIRKDIDENCDKFDPKLFNSIETFKVRLLYIREPYTEEGNTITNAQNSFSYLEIINTFCYFITKLKKLIIVMDPIYDNPELMKARYDFVQFNYSTQIPDLNKLNIDFGSWRSEELNRIQMIISRQSLTNFRITKCSNLFHLSMRNIRSFVEIDVSLPDIAPNLVELNLDVVEQYAEQCYSGLTDQKLCNLIKNLPKLRILRFMDSYRLKDRFYFQSIQLMADRAKSIQANPPMIFRVPINQEWKRLVNEHLSGGYQWWSLLPKPEFLKKLKIKFLFIVTCTLYLKIMTLVYEGAFKVDTRQVLPKVCEIIV
ncbi:hypothetical protein BLOT_014233 [Blomia tropicalis]|nr:hypothetical protein BLOT_014233 [Blomia tropicalis]